MLTLTMLRCPEGVSPESRQVSGASFSIGRDLRNDWVLPDPERFLSKRHCVLSFSANGWQIADTSTNGTYLNHDIDPIRDAPRGLRDGDRILLGSYEMEVALQDGEEPLYRPAEPNDGLAGLPHGRAGLQPGALPQTDDRLLGDPFPSAPTDPLGLAKDDGIGLSDRYDPLAPVDDLVNDAPVAADHSFLDARFRPPGSSANLLPDDWDDEITPPAPAEPAPPPVDMPLPPLPRAELPEPPMPEMASALPPESFVQSGLREPVPASAESLPGDAGFAAFLAGAGLRPVVTPTGPAALATLQALGGAFRAVVHGLRRIMIGRASIKGEFRIEQTMIRASGNNPLKFSADDEDALAALLNLGRRSDLSPEAAIADAMQDMHLHEVAMMTAMQEAVRDLLKRLEPQRMMDDAGNRPLDMLPGLRKARAWTAFETQHRQVVSALSDDFDSVFGKAFARAYERAMAEAQDKPERQRPGRQDSGRVRAPTGE